jgi:hypothetical protein
VLCYSRMLFFQFYPTFNRFLCKVFLTDALRFLGGACSRCMIDNTHVVVLHGTGAHMVPVPEMAAFGERYGFDFAAHEVGDANRSGRVEAPFAFIEGFFLGGRRFADWSDANQQAATWCDKVNRTYKKHLRAVPFELYVSERPHLRQLPAWIPEVYQLQQRIVDLEGYVTLHTNRYSAPYALIGRALEVRETKDRIDLYQGPRMVASHRRVLDPCATRITDPRHRPPRGQHKPPPTPLPEETAILTAVPELADYVDALKRCDLGRGTLILRRFVRLLRDYPRAPFLEAVRTAAHYKLYDLGRLERMVLRNLGQKLFLLPETLDEDPPHD